MIEIDTSWEWIAMYGPGGGRWKVRVGGGWWHFWCEIFKVQYSTVHYSTVQYSTVQYSTVQYSTVQYSNVQNSMKLLYMYVSCIRWNLLEYKSNMVKYKQ